MRLKSIQLLASLTLLTLAAPVWARTHSATAISDGSTTIAGTQLKAGDYELKVDDNASQLQVIQNGKVVAQAPVHWVQLQQKPADTSVLIDGDKIVEVDFGGKTQAVQVVSSQ
ncbi:MAG TPA: hypothetical protein VHN10_07065 [Candidatus Acidoferrales bacterium]|jgi:hypothetical protein|nr:hypothetical protein [Candidatus Acidoferrales bacterium]